MIKYWESFFKKLPQSFSETEKRIGTSGSLGTLRSLCGGKMRYKDLSAIKPRVRVSQFVDKVTYNGHAVRAYMNREIEARMRSEDFLLTGSHSTITIYLLLTYLLSTS